MITTLSLVECPPCDGTGVIGVCANDGSHGCSHVFDREYTCSACDGTGQVTHEQLQNPAWCPQCGLAERCPECTT